MKKLNRRKLIVCSILLILFIIVMFIMLFDKKLIFDTEISESQIEIKCKEKHDYEFIFNMIE